MAIVVVFQSTTLTEEKYQESVRQLTGGRDRFETRSDWPVPGLLVHVAGQGPGGFRVIDVWESDEAFQQFSARLLPILKAMGVEERPEVYTAHTVVPA